MGCDIHLYVEQRKGDGRWHAVRPPTPLREPETYRPFVDREWPEVRDYLTFAALSGVRHYPKEREAHRGIEPGVPNGLPADLSTEVSEEAGWWADDGHSRSHATLEEFERRVRAAHDANPVDTGEPWWVTEVVEPARALPGEVRFVWWFDN